MDIYNGEKGIRPTKQGKHELTLRHHLLPGGRVFRNFDTPAQAVAYKRARMQELQQGLVLRELLPTAVDGVKRSASPRLSDLLEAYLGDDMAKIARSGQECVEALARDGDMSKATLATMTTGWVDSWVRKMKREDRLAPGTIRKKVEALARAVEWHHRKQNPAGHLPPNPLRTLPRGYSSYGDDDGPARVDVKRDRRLNPGEFERIVATAVGEKRDDRERPWGSDPALCLLFQIIVHTALRLREAYTLEWKNVRWDARTLHIPRTKKDRPRDVPMTAEVRQLLKDWEQSQLLELGELPDNVFPWWTGSRDEDILRGLTSRLSMRFRSLFAYAKADDLREHDLRHEGVCRWMEMQNKDGRWKFRPEEVMIITGHKSPAMLQRYLSMRGSDLADRLDD
jgi:integrase